MLRIILGIIVGFIVWSVFWVGSNFVLIQVSHDWWAKNLYEMQVAANGNRDFTSDSMFLIISLLRSVVCSLISGFVTAFIARENTKSTLILGILLLAFGIFAQTIYWKVMPLWYHFSFLLLLIPVTIIGGKFRKFTSPEMHSGEA